MKNGEWANLSRHMFSSRRDFIILLSRFLSADMCCLAFLESIIHRDLFLSLAVLFFSEHNLEILR